MPFVHLCSECELPSKNEAREFSCGDREICVANVDGTITAMDNVCLHVGGPLGQGVIAGGKVVCPWHGWQYDPKTGQAGTNPSAKVAVYAIKVDNGEVLVDL